MFFWVYNTISVCLERYRSNMWYWPEQNERKQRRSAPASSSSCSGLFCFSKKFLKLYSKMPFWIPISKGGLIRWSRKSDWTKKWSRSERSLTITEKSSLRASPCMNRSGQRAVTCGTASCRAWGNTEKKIFRKMYATAWFLCYSLVEYRRVK